MDAYREVYGDVHVESAQVLAWQERGDLFSGRDLHLALDSQNRQRLFGGHNHGVEGDGKGLGPAVQKRHLRPIDLYTSVRDAETRERSHQVLHCRNTPTAVRRLQGSAQCRGFHMAMRGWDGGDSFGRSSSEAYARTSRGRVYSGTRGDATV